MEINTSENQHNSENQNQIQPEHNDISTNKPKQKHKTNYFYNPPHTSFPPYFHFKHTFFQFRKNILILLKL